jgi:hypothetical protein
MIWLTKKLRLRNRWASVPPRRIEDDWVCCRPLIGEEDPTSKFRVERPAGQKPV